MSDNIIVGVTEAPAAHRAVVWAAQRAADRRQKLVLLSIVGGAIGAVGEDEVLQGAVARAHELLARKAAELDGRGIDIELRVERGNPVATLLEASKGAALLVIGTDYRGPHDGPARGAHGVRIAAGADCPVVVVPDFDVEDRRGVVVGVDGSQVSENAVRFAAAEAERTGEPLVAVTVWTPLAAPRNPGVYPELYLANMAKLAEETLALSLAGLRQDFPDLEIIRRVEQGYPSRVINEIAQTARITVMGSHGRGALARFLLGSISHEVLTRVATVTIIVR